ncbi:MarR family winged helix-turn-helix transcriptional regulator [Streptomyces antimycoticus]|uniref:MarR family winged helix-turn-helix transcriptional regulator n=1 Tax=Streptomyces antimycoticus TaxID=68175 RepID=UPI0037D2BC78
MTEDQPAPSQDQHSQHPAHEQLHFWSFIDHAIASTTRVPGLDPLAMRLVLTLHRAANMIVYDLESSVHRPRGLSWGGFRVLFVIWLAGPMEARKVAELSGMSRAAVSALVNTLERDGLVIKERAPYDGRAVLLGLSNRGREVIMDAFTAHNARESEWAGALSQQDQETLVALLEKLTTHSAHFDARHRS